MKPNLSFVLIFLVFLLSSTLLQGAYRESVGWNRLVEELGDAVPAGRGVKVSLIESTAGGAYQPDTNNFDFAGKTFTIMSGPSGISSHATVVGQRFFGNSMSMAGGIDSIDVYEAVDWLLEGFLRVNREPLPGVETSRIQNHSWAGSFADQSRNVEAVRRLDYAIERDRFLAVVALRNDTGQVPPLMAHAYNILTIGRVDGSHSRGGTWFEGGGRIRPDLVAPGGLFTSYSAPVVSSAAAILLEEADRTPALANARSNPEVIRAILMAGATKDPFPGWSRDDQRPIDEVFGAGRLDIYSSYRILAGGDQEPDDDEPIPASGWHLGNIASNDSTLYRFSFGTKQKTLTAHLAWNRHVGQPQDLNFLDVEILVPRLELRLFRVVSGFPNEEIQGSLDPINNNQHLFLRDLPAGDYILRVDRIDDLLLPQALYGLAWDAASAPPSTFTEWQTVFFSAEELENPGISGALADPDGDGVENLLEYALGLNPLSSSTANLPAAGVLEVAGEPHLTLSFTRPTSLADLAYRVAASDDLITWGDDAVKVSATLLDEDNEEVVYRHPQPLTNGSVGFLRLEVEFQ